MTCSAVHKVTCGNAFWQISGVISPSPGIFKCADEFLPISSAIPCDGDVTDIATCRPRKGECGGRRERDGGGRERDAHTHTQNTHANTHTGKVVNDRRTHIIVCVRARETRTYILSRNIQGLCEVGASRCNTLLQHTTATYYCKSLDSPCCNTLWGGYD